MEVSDFWKEGCCVQRRLPWSGKLTINPTLKPKRFGTKKTGRAQEGSENAGEPRKNKNEAAKTRDQQPRAQKTKSAGAFDLEIFLDRQLY